MGGRGASGGIDNKVQKTVKNAEDEIRKSKTEFATLVGGDGSILFTKTSGLVDAVSFDAGEVGMMRNGILTHNHPSGSTFSDDDINIALNAGLREIRACHKNGVYVLTRQYNIGDVIPSDYPEFASRYELAVNSYMRRTLNQIYTQTGDADRCNKMLDEFRRDWLKRLSGSYGWEYREE